ncbi:MAG: DNA repair ATPase [Oleiphilaceae bacterium]|nr:DNA repair ATPase [Oleiphilaceae bacterium]
MSSRQKSFNAVFFMENHKVARQLLYSEFEALLDGMGTLPDYEDQEAQGVYVRMNQYGRIKALVFFLLYFDENGQADASWNVPIERLAEISGSGPDLGAGPIKLSCRSQCAINWHQDDLWDPDMTPGSNDFLRIKKACEENRLRFKFEEDEDIPVLGGDADVSENDLDKRTKLARLIKEQRLRIRTLESSKEVAHGAQDREQRLLVHTYKNEIQELKQQIEQLRVTNERLQEKLSSRNQQFIDLQDKASNQRKLVEQLSQQVKQATGGEREQLEKKKLEAEVVLLREQLDRKNMDLAMRDEREAQLRAELEELKEEGSGGSGDQVLDRLKALEVVYTAYHPGAGHITMSTDEVKRYVENPASFVAEKCFVTEEHYKAWLEHFDHPVCRFKGAQGVCNKALDKIYSPSDFEPGVDDRCEAHQRVKLNSA